MRRTAIRFSWAAGILFAASAGAQTTSLPAVADTYLRQGAANQNQGQQTILEVQQSGHHRTLVRMDQAAIAAAVGNGSLAAATLELYVSSSGNWGATGRTVDLHRLTAAWTENGATWNCADDTNPSNSQANCATQWAGGSFDDEATDSILHTNATSGRVQLNVTADVRAFLAGTPNHGWLAKLADETVSGNADYGSRQGASDKAPRLVLVVESASFDQVPPSLAITAPASTFLINDTTPEIGLAYGDGGSGVDLSSLAVLVDGVAAPCTPGPASALCEPAILGEGSHTITATLRDQAGNQAASSRSFTLLIGPGRRSATFAAVGDTFLRLGEPNHNYGGESFLRVRQSGKNRSLARFDAAEIGRIVGQGTLSAARLELTVSKNGRNWGRNGRTVDVHRLTADWTESGATWNCAIDTQPTNGQANCAAQWAGGTFEAAPTGTVLHTNDLAGTVSFDVTADVASLLAGTPAYGWLVKKTVEGESGLVEYASREAGAATGTAPRLVVFFDVPAGGGDTTPPSIAITAPLGTVYNAAPPAIRVEYSDAGSGVDPASLVVRVDGVAVAGCTAGSQAASCVPAPLAQGAHTVEAEIADRAGNRGSAGASFVIATDAEPPLIGIARPEGTLFNASTVTIELTYSDEPAGIDPASLAVSVDGSVLGSCTRSEFSASCTTASLAPGSHTIHATVRDRAGNQASADGVFEIVADAAAPSLAIVSPPASGSAEGAVPPLRLTYSDGGAGIDLSMLSVAIDGGEILGCATSLGGASCSLSTLTAGSHTASVSIADLAGNRADAALTFAVAAEREAPFLRIVAPAPGLISGSRIPAIDLEYQDGSGVDLGSLRVRIDEADVTAICQPGPTSAHCGEQVLAAGLHDVVAEIADTLGNRARVSIEVEISLALAIDITALANGTVVRDATIRLEGTVSALANAVEVGEIEAEISGGSWVADGVPLREGSNALTVVARSAAGGVGSATVTVVRDTDSPRVAILSPRDGFVTSAAQIVVSGDLVDSGSSAAAQQPLTVRVNDQVPMIERKSFVLPDLLLVPGENRIEVTAEDAAGNVGRSAVTVRYVPDAAARIEMISGDFQEALVRETLPQPLLVRVVDSVGRPLAGRTVDFAVTRGDGALISFPDAARRLPVVTDGEGLAQVQLALGTRAGAGNQEVTASSLGIPGAVVFCATARRKAPQQLQPIVGTDFQGARSAAAGQPLPKPLLVQAFDEFGNPVPGVEIRFRSVAGGGGFAGANETAAMTDEEGKAGAIYTLGPDEGINNNVVEATFEGNEDHPARFVISGLVPGPAELTAISGVLLDPQDGPVPGARLHLGANETRTDAEGKFHLAGVPVGTVHLAIDGSTVTRPGVWPPLAYELVTVSGRDNSLGKPLRLPPLDDEGKKRVGGDEDVVIPIHGVAGATLTVFAHSATFPDGSREGFVSFTQVPSYKVPMVAPMNTNFQLAWSIQPPGVRFDPPARVSIPNFGGAASGGNSPGMTVEIFSFDHDLEEFVSAGTATITEDGQRMVSNPGMGVAKTGWGGCPRPPAPPAGTCSPGEPPGVCKLCPGNGPPVSKCTACETCSGGGCNERKVDRVIAQAEPVPPEGAAAQRTGKRRELKDDDGGGDEPVFIGEGEPLQFFSSRLRGDCAPERIKAKWMFGDDSAEKEGRTVEHTYEEEDREHTAMVSLECECPDRLRAKAAPVTDSLVVQVVKAVSGHFKMIDHETELTLVDKDEDGDGKKDNFFRLLGGMRVRFDLDPPAALAGRVSEYRWEIQGSDHGDFYRGWESNRPALLVDQLKGPTLKTIYYQAPRRTGQDFFVYVFLKIRDTDVTIRLKRRIKTRVLDTTSEDGDDVKMLQSALRLLGFSSGPTPGYAGTAVAVDGNFGPGTTRAVKRLEFVDDLTGCAPFGNSPADDRNCLDAQGTGIVFDAILQSLAMHWTDFVKAYDAYSTDSRLGTTHGDYPSWVVAGSADLMTVYTTAIHGRVAPTVAYTELLRSWVQQESAQGQWGHTVPFRITLGGADEKGSIGFDQIVNTHKYGSTNIASIEALNLYHPLDNVRGFAVFSNDQDAIPHGGGGFYRGFVAGVYSQTGPATGYPRPTTPYVDSEKDVLSKSVMAYNRGSNDSAARNQPWADMLRDYDPPPPGAGFGRRTSMSYTLEIQQRAGFPLRCWDWVEQAITTGADDQCNTPRLGTDVSIPGLQAGVANQVCLVAGVQEIARPGNLVDRTADLASRIPAGTNDRLVTWTHRYCETDWLRGETWQAARARQVPSIVP